MIESVPSSEILSVSFWPSSVLNSKYVTILFKPGVPAMQVRIDSQLTSFEGIDVTGFSACFGVTATGLVEGEELVVILFFFVSCSWFVVAKNVPCLGDAARHAQSSDCGIKQCSARTTSAYLPTCGIA